MMNAAAETIRPWYREPLAWLVFALPLSAVVAGIATVFIAVGGADSLVVDDFQKVGLVAERRGAMERRAEELGVAITASLDRESGMITARIEGERVADQLVFDLHHATQPALDQRIVLQRDAAGLHRGSVGKALPGRWYVRIADESNGWRVTTRLSATDRLIEFGGMK